MSSECTRSSTENKEVDRYKARLVAKGYRQKYGIDYEEVSALIAQLNTMRLLISLEANHKWKIYHFDKKSAFLNDILEKVVYVQRSKGFLIEAQENKVYRLKKALHNLKQEPRTWNAQIDGYLHQNGFAKCPYEHAIYMKMNYQGEFLIICLYVDDLFCTESSVEMIVEFKVAMFNEFEMTDNVLVSYFLGIEVKQQQDGIFVSQKKYMNEVLEKFKMNEYNSVNTPIATKMKLSREGDGGFMDLILFKSLVGILRYLMITRPDITYTVRLISRYMETPK